MRLTRGLAKKLAIASAEAGQVKEGPSVTEKWRTTPSSMQKVTMALQGGRLLMHFAMQKVTVVARLKVIENECALLNRTS